MPIRVTAVISLAAGTLLAGVTVIGCANTTNTTNPTKSSPAFPAPVATRTQRTMSTMSTAPTTTAAQPADYASLLIKPTDIPSWGDTFDAQPPAANPHGVPGTATVFTNRANTHAIGDTILVLPDPNAAATALQGAKDTLGTVVANATPRPAPVGNGGITASGTSPDGSKAMTVLMFTEGRAFATLEFASAPGDPVSAGFVTDVGQKQDAVPRNSPPD